MKLNVWLAVLVNIERVVGVCTGGGASNSMNKCIWNNIYKNICWYAGNRVLSTQLRAGEKKGAQQNMYEKSHGILNYKDK
jgi:hypothetical protein